MKQIPKYARLLFFLFCGTALAACGDQAAKKIEQAASVPPSAKPAALRRHEFRTYKDLKALFEELGYTPESWRRGSRAVPSVGAADRRPELVNSGSICAKSGR